MLAAMPVHPRALPLVFVPDDALAAGYTPGQVHHRVRTGQWRRLGKGLYTSGDLLDSVADRPRLRHALAVMAAVRRIEAPAAASGPSAAFLLGMTDREPADVELTAAPDPGRRARTYRGLRLRTAGVPAEHLTETAGVPVTTAARTVVDLARRHSFNDAVATADAALHRRLCTPDNLVQVLLDCATWPGIRRAQHVVAFADGRSESVLESCSRVMHRDQGLPAAELQARIVDPAGFVARVDFLWRAQRTVGEADGRGKYDDRHALWAEKRREDRLREMGLEVVRWGWGDLSQPWVTARRIREAFARARARTG
jgi:hypothetical protein